MKPYMQRPGHERRIYPVLQGLASDTTMRSLKEIRDAAVDAGGQVLVPIHDEITIEVPSEARVRRLLSRLARLLHPMPPLVIADPVASYLIRHYGVPSRSTTT
jgi:hypothetical protein